MLPSKKRLACSSFGSRDSKVPVGAGGKHFFVPICFTLERGGGKTSQKSHLLNSEEVSSRQQQQSIDEISRKEKLHAEESYHIHCSARQLRVNHDVISELCASKAKLYPWNTGLFVQII